MSFYDEVMRELVLALGGALFLANAFALARRRADARQVPTGKSPKRTKSAKSGTDLAQAPIARTVTYMLIGLDRRGLGARVDRQPLTGG